MKSRNQQIKWLRTWVGLGVLFPYPWCSYSELLNPFHSVLLILSKLSSSLFLGFLSLDPRITFRFLHSLWLPGLQLLASSPTFVCSGDLQLPPFSRHQKLWLSLGRLLLPSLGLARPVRLLLPSPDLGLLLCVLRGRALGHHQSIRVLFLPGHRLCELWSLGRGSQWFLRAGNKLWHLL